MPGLSDLGDDSLRVPIDSHVLTRGGLVDLAALGVEIRFHGQPVTAMSRSLFDALWPLVERRATPATALASILRTKLQDAVFLAGSDESAGYLYELPSGEPDNPIWLSLDEATGTWRVMLSGDYTALR